MSITEVITTGLSGLNASQAGLRAVSNNLANVQTPGYARERVGFVPNVIGGRVSGVAVATLQRAADRFLDTASFEAAGDVGRLAAIDDHLGRLQTLLGQPGAPTNLSAKFDRIKAAAVEMTSPGVGSTSIQAFVAAVESALADMKDLSAATDRIAVDAADEVDTTLERINTLVERVSVLNDDVAIARAFGRSAAGQEDQRAAALEELGQLVEVRVRTQSDGRLFLETAGGVALLDGQPRTLRAIDPSSGAARSVYGGIEVAFLDRESRGTTLTGEVLGASIGGKVGALVDLRDRILPDTSADLGQLFGSFATMLNTVHNANSSIPASNALVGRTTGLVGADLARLSGQSVIAVTDRAGQVVARTALDFDALGPTATIDDVVAAINGGLGGAATASFSGGRLTIRAASSTNGVAIADDPTRPSSRAGFGFSQAFGLNDLIQSSASIIPAGLAFGDPLRLPAGQTIDLALRDASGRVLARHEVTTTAGATVGDFVSELNASPLGPLGQFGLDANGRLQITPNGNTPLSILLVADSTTRTGSGARLGDLLAIGDRAGALALGGAGLRSDVALDPTRLSVARLEPSAAVSRLGIAGGDSRGATAFVDSLSGQSATPGLGAVSIDSLSADFIGRTSAVADRVASAREDAQTRLTDLVQRRDEVSGVSIDEELAQMVLYQASYSAAARLITTANDMYAELLSIVG